MSWSTLRRALDWALCAESPGPQITFSGGEPLLEARLIRRAVDHLATRAPAMSRDAPSPRFTLDTNALLLDDPMIAFLVAHDFDLDISFDGVAPAQERRAPGTFTQLDALLDQLRREHPGYYRRHLRVSMTVLPETLPHLADSFAYFLAKRVQEIAVAPVFAPGAGRAPVLAPRTRCVSAQLRELETQFDRILRLSLDHYRETGEIPIAALRPASGGAAYPCGVIHGDAPTVDVNGDVYGCALLVEPAHARAPRDLREELRDLRMGNLRDPDFGGRLADFRRRAHASPLFCATPAARSARGACVDCPSLGNCSVCPIALRLADTNAGPHAIADWPCAFARVASRMQAEFTRMAGASQSSRPADHALLERFLGRPLPSVMRRLAKPDLTPAAETDSPARESRADRARPSRRASPR